MTDRAVTLPAWVATRQPPGATRSPPHRAARLMTELMLELVGVMLEPGDDLTAVSTGGAPARLRRVERHDVHATLGEVQRGRQARVAGADHHDIGAALAGERPRLGKRLASDGPGRDRRRGRRHSVRATRVPSRRAWWMPRGATQSPIACSAGTLPLSAR